MVTIGQLWHLGPSLGIPGIEELFLVAKNQSVKSEEPFEKRFLYVKGSLWNFGKVFLWHRELPLVIKSTNCVLAPCLCKHSLSFIWLYLEFMTP